MRVGVVGLENEAELGRSWHAKHAGVSLVTYKNYTSKSAVKSKDLNKANPKIKVIVNIYDYSKFP